MRMEQTVAEWSQRIESSKDILNHPPREQVRMFLEECGADFSKIKEASSSLKKSTNAGNAKAMSLIWGEETFKRFKKWAKNYVYQYEATTYEKLPRLEGGKVGSGEIRAFCLLTKFAADESFSDRRFSLELEIRRKNGELRSLGMKREDLRRISRPDTGEVYTPGSFPPGFLDALVYEITTWKK